MDLVRVERTAGRSGHGLDLVLQAERSVVLLSLERLALLEKTLAETAREPKPPAWVRIRSACDGSFAAGADLREISGLSAIDAFALSRAGQRVMRWLSDGPWISGALVDGHALGGGFDLATACDVVVATQRSQFGHPGVARGFFTGWGGTARLPRIARARQAAVWLSLGERIDARQAFDAGILAGVAEDAGQASRQLERLIDALAAWPAARREAWRCAARGDAARSVARALCCQHEPSAHSR